MLFGVTPWVVREWFAGIVRSGDRPRGQLFVALLSAVALCGTVLLLDRSFDRDRLWRGRAERGCVGRVIRRNAAIGAMLLAGIAALAPDKLLEFPRERPLVWLVVMIVYPLFSAYPQELVYRAFMFHRYAPLFASGGRMVLASAAAFGWAHVVMHNWLAVGLSLIAGVFFARTYSRTESLAAAWLDHSLLGCLAFTTGLGSFFYAGAISLQ